MSDIVQVDLNIVFDVGMVEPAVGEPVCERRRGNSPEALEELIAESESLTNTVVADQVERVTSNGPRFHSEVARVDWEYRARQHSNSLQKGGQFRTRPGCINSTKIPGIVGVLPKKGSTYAPPQSML
jgi:hypothetical protein